MTFALNERHAELAGVATSFPGAVLAPWAVSRAAVFLTAQHAAAVRGHSGFAAFAVWDGNWYVEIARTGYGFLHRNGESPYPFFPLLPALLRAGRALGFPPIAFGVVLNHVVFLLALWGLYEITRDHFGPLVAAAATWCLALFPGSAPLTMVYPSAIFVACAVWAFRSLEHGRDLSAAGLAAIAALVRPNGLVVALALACAALLESRSWRRPLKVASPAVACVVAWMAFLWWQSGDPLAFVHAKAAWHEVTLAALLDGREPIPKYDVAPLVYVAVVLAFAGRSLPPAWLVLVALSLLPSLALGMLGMPRYTAACFPIFVAAGLLLEKLPFTFRVAALATSGVGLIFIAHRLVLLEQMP